MVKKYRFAALFSLPASLFRPSPGTDGRERGFWSIYTAEGCQRTDMTTWMPLLWTTFGLLAAKRRKKERKRVSG